MKKHNFFLLDATHHDPSVMLYIFERKPLNGCKTLPKKKRAEE